MRIIPWVVSLLPLHMSSAFIEKHVCFPQQALQELSLEDQVARIIAGCGDVIPEATAVELATLETEAAAAAGRHDRVKMVIMGLPNAVCVL